MTSELYYAEMEAARNEIEQEYFAAHPQLNRLGNRTVFRVGFERGFQWLWDRVQRLERELAEARALMYRWTLYECGDESLPTDTLYRETYDALGLPANMQAMKSAVGITDKPADQPEGER